MQKIKRGTGFRGVLNYALAGGPVIGGNMAGMTPRELANEFGQARKIREDIKKPVWHNSLRLPAGERLSAEKWNQIANDYMRRMGFGDLHQRAHVMHDHPEGQHVHIISNRIDMTGKIYYGQNENLKSTQIIRELEREHNLTISADNLEKKNDRRNHYKHTPKPHPSSFGRTTKNGMRKLSECSLAHSRQGEKSPRVLQVDVRPSGRHAERLRWSEPARRRPTAGEVGMAERTSEAPIRMQLQAIIDEATQDKPSFADFVERLGGAGVAILPSGKTGVPQGVSYALNDQPFKGSDLGKAYAFKGLKSRIDYDPERDQHIIDRLRQLAQKDQEEEKGELSPTVPHFAQLPIYKGQPRTLELALEKHGNLYKWKGRDRTALIDNGESISVMSKADSAIRASLQLSKDKGWRSLTATGSGEFRRKSWLIGSEMGLKVEGYEPSQADRDELKNILVRKEAARNERKNSRDAKQSNSPGATSNDRQRAGGVSAADSNRFELDSRGPGSENRSGAESNGGTRQQDRVANGVQAPGSAGASDSRGPDLARDSSVIGDRRYISSIRNVAVQVADIAAPICEDRRTEQEGRAERANNLQSITKDHAAKIAAWREQHAALGAPHYRITLVDRDPERIKKHGRMGLGYVLGKKTESDIKTPHEVEAVISTLRRENARKFDIYITPIDDQHHYVLLDDIHEEKAGKLRRFRADSFAPALIQFSSNDNFQAILKVPKSDGDHDFANQIFQKLNTDYGEAGIKGGVVHPFRMAGFANKKPGKSGFTRLIEANPGATCEKTSGLIKSAMENHDAEKRKKDIEREQKRRLQAIENHNQMPLNPGGNDAVLRAYKKSFNRTLGLAKQKGWTIDYSRIDFAAAKDLVKQGYKTNAIEQSIIVGSPNLDQRKGQYMADYARLTVQKAMVSSDVIQHKARTEAQQAQRSGPMF